MWNHLRIHTTLTPWVYLSPSPGRRCKVFDKWEKRGEITCYKRNNTGLDVETEAVLERKNHNIVVEWGYLPVHFLH